MTHPEYEQKVLGSGDVFYYYVDHGLRRPEIYGWLRTADGVDLARTSGWYHTDDINAAVGKALDAKTEPPFEAPLSSVKPEPSKEELQERIDLAVAYLYDCVQLDDANTTISRFHSVIRALQGNGDQLARWRNRYPKTAALHKG